MNETKLPDPRLDTPPPEETPEKRDSLGGRILGYSFLASVVINLGWLGWVSSSNLFGGKAPLDLHPQIIKMVKIPQKPKPKPPEKKPPPPPPPPKQKPPPPLKTPPKIQPKVQPKIIKPRAAALRPSPTHQVHVAQSTRSTSPAPAMPTGTPQPAAPVNPGVESHAAPTPPAPPQPTPVPPAPVPQAPKPEPKSTPPPPPPPPPKPDPPKPKGWVPIESREAVDVQSVDVSADGIDAGSINNNEVVISYTIDETGHVKNARVKKSCGSSELDNRVLQQVQRQRCAPAIQDHIPRESRQEFHFPVNS